MDMARFEAIDDPGFIAVAGELRRWTKEIARAGRPRPLQPRAVDTEYHSGIQEAGTRNPERHTVSIVQGGSEFNGSTTVSGGVLFQGNHVGLDRNIF